MHQKASRVLVAYHSESGHTRQVAEEIAAQLSADIERIRPARPLRSTLVRVLYALMDRDVALETPEHDAGAYDLVVIGSPVWAARATPVVRSYLRACGPELPAVALYVTLGSSGAERALDGMSRLVGTPPIARMAIDDRDRREGDDMRKIHAFATEIEARMPTLSISASMG